MTLPCSGFWRQQHSPREGPEGGAGGTRTLKTVQGFRAHREGDSLDRNQGKALSRSGKIPLEILYNRFLVDSFVYKTEQTWINCFEHRTSFPCQKTKGQWVRCPQRSQTRHVAVLGERQESPSSPSPCHSLGTVPGAELEAQKGPLLGL